MLGCAKAYRRRLAGCSRFFRSGSRFSCMSACQSRSLSIVYVHTGIPGWRFAVLVRAHGARPAGAFARDRTAPARCGIDNATAPCPTRRDPRGAQSDDDDACRRILR